MHEPVQDRGQVLDSKGDYEKLLGAFSLTVNTWGI